MFLIHFLTERERERGGERESKQKGTTSEHGSIASSLGSLHLTIADWKSEGLNGLFHLSKIETKLKTGRMVE